MNGSHPTNVLGENGSIASPPDNSVSSSDELLKQNLLMSSVAASSSDVAITEVSSLGGGKSSCLNTEESEVTSSSEILIQSCVDCSPTSDPLPDITDKNLFNVMSDEDINCIESILLTEEGRRLLQESNPELLSSKTDGGDGVVTELSDCLTDPSCSDSSQISLDILRYAALAESEVTFDAIRIPYPEIFLEETDPDTFPDDMCASSANVTDVLISDVLEVCQVLERDRRDDRLFDDDNDDNDVINIDNCEPSLQAAQNSFDDLSFLNLSSVASEDKQPDVSTLGGVSDLLFDESFLQNLTLLGQSFATDIDQNNSNLEELAFDDDDINFGLKHFNNETSTTAAADCNNFDLATSKHLRRSTRIQEHEQKEMADRIRYENQLMEQIALRGDDKPHDRGKHRDCPSHGSDLDLSSCLHSESDDELFLDDSLHMEHEKAIFRTNTFGHKGKGKGKGKGRGKGGKGGKLSIKQDGIVKAVILAGDTDLFGSLHKNIDAQRKYSLANALVEEEMTSSAGDIETDETKKFAKNNDGVVFFGTVTPLPDLLETAACSRDVDEEIEGNEIKNSAKKSRKSIKKKGSEGARDLLLTENQDNIENSEQHFKEGTTWSDVIINCNDLKKKKVPTATLR